MWILLIIFMMMFSIYLSFKIRFKNYKINIKEIIKNDKSALFLALGTKIGVGSIIGTVSSIIIGGFSSVIWIIVFSFITTSLTYYEAYLGNKYKQIINNGSIGGPYFILKNGLNSKILSVVSIVILIILYSFLFQMIQVNTIYNIVKNTLNINNLCIILFIISVLMIVLNLSIDRIRKLMNIIVPFKCILFISLCLFGIISHYNELLFSLKNVFNNLFTFKSLMSGMIIGCLRSVFMNEILIGTTSISSGSDKNNIDVSIKYQLFGVYFITLMNTLLISSLVLVYSRYHYILNDYNLLITNIFKYTTGNIGSILLMIILVLFAFTTLLSGFYILKSNVEYLFNNKIISLIFKILFFIIVISSIFIGNNSLWKYTDILIFIMIIINSYSIIKLMRK